MRKSSWIKNSWKHCLRAVVFLHPRAPVCSSSVTWLPLGSSLSLPRDPLSLILSPSPSACFLIGWGNVGNFMWSLSQPPGHPDPPLVVWLPRRAGVQAARACGSAAQGGCPKPGHWWGPWETQSSANSWTGVGSEAWGSATLPRKGRNASSVELALRTDEHHHTYLQIVIWEFETHSRCVKSKFVGNFSPGSNSQLSGSLILLLLTEMNLISLHTSSPLVKLRRKFGIRYLQVR